MVVKDTEKLLELLATSAGTTVFPILVAGTFVSLITRNTEKEIAANKEIVGQQIAALHTTIAANDQLLNQRIAAEKEIVAQRIAAEKEIVGQQIAALYTAVAAEKESVQFERKELEKVFVEKFEKFENALKESKLLN